MLVLSMVLKSVGSFELRAEVFAKEAVMYVHNISHIVLDGPQPVGYLFARHL
jgi:hypothetical protein